MAPKTDPKAAAAAESRTEAQLKEVRAATYAFNRQRANVRTVMRSLEDALDHHEEAEEPDYSNIQESIISSLLQDMIDEHKDMLKCFKDLGRTDTTNKEIDDAGDEADTCTNAFLNRRTRAVAILANFEKHKRSLRRANRNDTSQAGGGDGNDEETANLPKVHTAFKPHKLAANASITEFQRWREQYKAFYEMSGLHKYPLNAVHTTFFNSIDADLERKIRARTDAETPTMGAGSLMEMLDKLISSLNPMSIRRLDFFLRKQKQHEKFSDFIAVMEQKASVADLAAITADILLAHLCIAACNDQALRKELLKEDTEPSMAAIRRTTENWEAMNATSKKIDRVAGGHHASGHHVSRGRSKSRRGRGKSKARSKSKANNVKRIMLPKGVCWRCGDEGHSAPDCRKPKESITCGYCNKKGHVTKMCKSKLSDEKKGAVRRRSPSASPKRRGKFKANAVRARVAKSQTESEKSGISVSRSLSSSCQNVDKMHEKGPKIGENADLSKSEISTFRSDDKDQEAEKASEKISGSDAGTFAPPKDNSLVNEENEMKSLADSLNDAKNASAALNSCEKLVVEKDKNPTSFLHDAASGSSFLENPATLIEERKSEQKNAYARSDSPECSHVVKSATLHNSTPEIGPTAPESSSDPTTKKKRRRRRKAVKAAKSKQQLQTAASALSGESDSDDFWEDCKSSAKLYVCCSR